MKDASGGRIKRGQRCLLPRYLFPIYAAKTPVNRAAPASIYRALQISSDKCVIPESPYEPTHRLKIWADQARRAKL